MDRATVAIVTLALFLVAGAERTVHARGVPLPLNSLLSLTFGDARHGWLLGTSCPPNTACTRVQIRRTYDGGHTWTHSTAPPARPGWVGTTGSNAVRALLFLDGQLGWAYGPALYRTVDGGASWQRMLVQGETLGMVRMSGHAWALIRFCSSSRSCSLSLMALSAGSSRVTGKAIVRGISVTDASLTKQGNILWVRYRTSVGRNAPGEWLERGSRAGTTWTRFVSPCAFSPYPGILAEWSSRLWLLCSGQPAAGSQLKTLYLSTSAARHWTTVSGGSTRGGGVPSSGYVSSLVASRGSDLWLTLDRGTLWKSTDGGRAWQVAVPASEANPPLGNMGPVTFVSMRRGFVLGGLNRLLSTGDGGRHWSLHRAQ